MRLSARVLDNTYTHDGFILCSGFRAYEPTSQRFQSQPILILPSNLTLKQCTFVLYHEYTLINPPSDERYDTLRTDEWYLAGPPFIHMHLYVNICYFQKHLCTEQVYIFHLLPFSLVLAYVMLNYLCKKNKSKIYSKSKKKKHLFASCFLFCILSDINVV